ncbi:hypothetical protein Hdeb2414_s0003g00087121 [Helianthus debilis subsp. tardiflorus]
MVVLHSTIFCTGVFACQPFLSVQMKLHGLVGAICLVRMLLHEVLYSVPADLY